MTINKIVLRPKRSRLQSRFLVESKLFLANLFLSSERLTQSLITVHYVNLNHNLGQLIVYFTTVFGSEVEVEKELSLAGAAVAAQLRKKFRSMKKLKVSFQKLRLE